MQLICTIEDVFNITDRGCVITPGIPHDFPVGITIDSTVLLETTSGNKIETTITGLEMINRRIIHQEIKKYSIPFLIKGDVLPEFLSKGVKVWLVEVSGSVLDTD